MVGRPTGATKSQEVDLEFKAGGVIMQIVIRFASQHAVYIIFYHGDQFIGSTRLVIALAVRGRSVSLGMTSATRRIEHNRVLYRLADLPGQYLFNFSIVLRQPAQTDTCSDIIHY